MPSWLGPPVIVFLGAAIAALGTLWSANRQGALNASLRAANERIITLQNESLEYVKGTASLTFMITPNHPYQNNKLELIAFNESKLPAYDVFLNIHDHIDTKHFDNVTKHEIGNIPYGIKATGIFLEPGYYQIDIRSRAGKTMEMLRFGPIDGHDVVSSMSFLVTDPSGKVIEKSTNPLGSPSVY